MAPPRTRPRVEIQSYGVDQTLQMIGGDPFGGMASLGVKVPSLATVSLPSATNQGLKSRYLFHLASFSVGRSGGCQRIIGYRLLVQLWAIQSSGSGNRIIKQTVYDPSFGFVDGNWSWHLRYIPDVTLESIRTSPISPVNQNDGTTTNLDGAAWRMSNTPSLLFETMKVAAGDPFYVDLLDYVPPNGGKPWGEPVADMGTFYGVSTPWNDSHGWHSLDIPCYQPGTYALFCSVRQTKVSGRLAIAAPTPFFSNGLSNEEQFVLNFPTANIGAVGGSLIVESESEDCGEIRDEPPPELTRKICDED